MSNITDLRLSKTRFTAGLRCLKLLYLDWFSQDLADPVDPSQQALLDSGTEVGTLARQCFPDGLLVEAPHNEHSRAMTSTSEALADTLIPAIYEAAFSFQGTMIRVDILSRNKDGTFDLVEVKSSTSVKSEHILDVAIQLHVLEGSCVPIRKMFLLHVDNTYLYRGGLYDVDRLFQMEDITGQVHGFLPSIPGSLSSMWEILHSDEGAPRIEIGAQCTRPYKCSFYSFCRQGLPEHAIEQLPRARPDFINKLRTAGIEDIRDIPLDFPGLTANQQRVRDSVASGRPYLGPELGDVLSESTYPLHFLDFETFSPALPIYPGTRPYQVMPFQWSLHVRHSDGKLSHASFLHDGRGDPRDAFSRSLLEAVGSEGTILVYSSYEQTIILQLASQFPEYQERLRALPDRFLDLLAVVRAYCYHPDFHGSYSIKAILPALVPGMTYGDLEIQDGSLASVYFARMIELDTEEPERERVRKALLDYCERDTLAMVRVLHALLSMSQMTTSQP